MRFSVAQLLKERVGATRSYIVDETLWSLSAAEPKVIAGRVQFLRTPHSVLVTASLNTSMVSICSRCLESYDHVLAFDMEEEYFPTVDIHTGNRLTIDELSDEGQPIDDCHVVDLHEIVRQYSIVNLPMKPLCRPSCEGIWPRREVRVGGAYENSIDPRWTSLRLFLTDNDSGRREHAPLA